MGVSTPSLKPDAGSRSSVCMQKRTPSLAPLVKKMLLGSASYPSRRFKNDATSSRTAKIPCDSEYAPTSGMLDRYFLARATVSAGKLHRVSKPGFVTIDSTSRKNVTLLCPNAYGLPMLHETVFVNGNCFCPGLAFNALLISIERLTIGPRTA